MTFDVRSVVADSIELLCYEIIQAICNEGGNVIYLSKQLEFLVGKIDIVGPHGSLACRLHLTKLILKVCSIPAHNEIAEGCRLSRKIRTSETLIQSRNKALSEFSPENWEGLIVGLKRLEANLRRKDARSILIPEKFKEFPILQEHIPAKILASDTSESSIEASDFYCPLNLDDIIDNLQVQQGLSYIRPMLFQNLSTKISLKQSSLFSDFIAKCIYDKNKYNDLALFFEDVETHTLKSRKEMKSILSSNDSYSLEDLQQKFREFIQRWHDQNLPIPILVKLNYKKLAAEKHIFYNRNSVEEETSFCANVVSREENVEDIYSRNKEKDSLSDASTASSTHRSEECSGVFQDAVSSLKNSTSHLSVAIGVDPLREIMEEINPNEEKVTDADPKRSDEVQVKTPEMYKKKKSAVTMEFSDSDDDSAEKRNQSCVEKLKPKKEFKRRKKFTEEEKDTIKEGVKKYGLGRWSMIKSENNNVLQTRTNVNIKDCYRTMLRNNEI